MKGLSPQLKRLLNKERINKYGNHKVHCLSKHLHDSKMEANYCNRLLAMKQSFDIISYKTQVSYDLLVNGILICRHIVDFEVKVPGAKYTADKMQLMWEPKIQVHDTKGVKTDVFIIKHKLFQAIYPHIEYKIITAH